MDSKIQNLANRWKRLVGVLIDTIIIILISLSLFHLFGYIEHVQKGGDITFVQTIVFGLLLNILFFGLNGYLLIKKGQTVGKYIVRIKITKLDGSIPSIWTIIFRRYLTLTIIALIPYIGQWLNILGFLLIFTKDRRCLHDYLAGTIVLNE